MLRLFFFLLYLCFYVDLFALNNVVGKSFFPQTGKTLSGKQVNLPDLFKNKFAFIAYGFSRKCQNDFDSWLIPFRKRYQSNNQVSYLEIPMIGEKSKVQRFFIQTGMKAGINKKLHDHIMVFFGDLAVYKYFYGFSQINVGYFFLVDKSSKIIWQYMGEASLESLDELFFKIDQLLEGEK